MKTITSALLLSLVLFSCAKKSGDTTAAVYDVVKLDTVMTIDGNWDKPQWKKAAPIDITHWMGPIPAFHPTAHAKMMYNDSNLFVIFHVDDQFVKSVVKKNNGPVSEDACVEFFFTPDLNLPDAYFNLEVNAGGAPLMTYHLAPRDDYKDFKDEDFKMIEIAHSLPAVVDPEMTTPVTWTIEYRIPIALLDKFATIPHPKAGVTWKANFYKTASKTSNPHWLTWSVVDNPTPNFHLPKYFGTIRFK